MNKKKAALLSSIIAGSFVLLKEVLDPSECKKCPVRTNPGVKWIMNPCVNCIVRGGTNPPPSPIEK